VASDCFGWSFVTNPNGGCIAFLGSTDVDVSHGGTAIITKGIEKLCLEISRNYQEGDATFGELWAHALTTYLNTADMDEMDYITVEEFQPFGDPSLCIRGDSQPPNTPSLPVGPTSGIKGYTYTYSSTTTDPEGNTIKYLFDWGNEDFSGWIGPYTSGEQAEACYAWEEEGEYHIRVKAKDEHGVQSEWSETITLTIGPTEVEITNITGGLGIHADIIVHEFIPAETITWSISLERGLIIYPLGHVKERHVPTPEPGTSIPISTFVFGIGFVDVIIKAYNITERTSGFVFGPLVFLNKT
jgi:hypothetical protein